MFCREFLYLLDEVVKKVAEHIANKIESLRKRIKKYEKAVIAFSGGVDSTFLLMVAVQELGERVLAVTLDSMLIPRQEIEEAQRIAHQLRANHKIVSLNPLEVPGVRENQPERCYHCKQYLFGALCDLAGKEGY